MKLLFGCLIMFGVAEAYPSHHQEHQEHDYVGYGHKSYGYGKRQAEGGFEGGAEGSSVGGPEGGAEGSAKGRDMNMGNVIQRKSTLQLMEDD